MRRVGAPNRLGHGLPDLGRLASHRARDRAKLESDFHRLVQPATKGDVDLKVDRITAVVFRKVRREKSLTVATSL
jgi:hypothetical protein